jgi:hypothetical protein
LAKVATIPEAAGTTSELHYVTDVATPVHPAPSS